MLLVEDVAKRFKSGGGAVDAVDGVSFEIATGTFAAIVGRSGSGKSTLLGLLGALDSPSAGKITMDDVDVTALSPRGQVAYRRDRIGFVFQQYHLIPDLTAVQNVMLPMEFAGRRTAERHARAVELLDRVGLTGGKQTRLPGRLSGGEQQRVSVARALANRPSLILADEPTGNLDSRNGKRIITLLREFAGGGTTVVVVTHDRGLASRADLTLAMNDGRIVHRKSKT